MKFANGKIPKFDPGEEHKIEHDSEEDDYMSVTSSSPGQQSKILGGLE
jgi:hypothetical protein